MTRIAHRRFKYIYITIDAFSQMINDIKMRIFGNRKIAVERRIKTCEEEIESLTELVELTIFNIDHAKLFSDKCGYSYVSPFADVKEEIEEDLINSSQPIDKPVETAYNTSLLT
jgi:hypothetical protein